MKKKNPLPFSPMIFDIILYCKNTYTYREMITALQVFVLKNVAKIKTLQKIALFFHQNFSIAKLMISSSTGKKLETFFSYNKKISIPPRCHLQINKENSAKSHFCDVCVII